MPWCEACSRFYNPNSLGAEGTCPSCGRKIDDPGSGQVAVKTPWHFKLLVVAVSVYLGWRFVELIVWLVT